MYLNKITSLALLGLATHTTLAAPNVLEQRQCIVRGGTCDPRPADPGCCDNMVCVVSARGYVCEPPSTKREVDSEKA